MTPRAFLIVKPDLLDTKEAPEQLWRVVLHKDDNHTYNYVIRSLCKIVSTLDRKDAFGVYVQCYRKGEATVCKTWKQQAEKYCLDLQRCGLTVSAKPDSLNISS